MENPGNVEPPDEKSVKKKKPKVTKEERKALRLEKNRLKALKRIENEKQLIRDRLNRELKYSKKNYENVTRHWLKFMNGLKSAELIKNLNVSASINQSYFIRMFLTSIVRKHGQTSITFLIAKIITSK